MSYEVIVRGIDYSHKVYEGFSKEEAYQEYFGSLSVANPSDEILIILDGRIIEDDCNADQFEIFDDNEFSEDDEMDIMDFGL